MLRKKQQVHHYQKFWKNSTKILRIKDQKVKVYYIYIICGFFSSSFEIHRYLLLILQRRFQNISNLKGGLVKLINKFRSGKITGQSGKLLFYFWLFWNIKPFQKCKIQMSIIFGLTNHDYSKQIITSDLVNHFE